MEILILAVSLVFLFLVYLNQVNRSYFKSHGKKSTAKVIGMKVSRTSSTQSSAGGTNYHPIYEYIFNGKPYRFTSGGSNIISQKIGDKVPIIYLTYGPEYVIPLDDPVGILWKIFGLMGFGSIILFYFLCDWEAKTKITLMLLTIVIPYIFVKIIFKKYSITGNKKNNKFDPLISSVPFNEDNLSKGEVILWENREINHITERVRSSSKVISTSFFVLSITGLFGVWNHMSYEGKEVFRRFFTDFQHYKEIKNQIFNKNPEVIFFLITIAFTLLSLHSLHYSYKKKN